MTLSLRLFAFTILACLGCSPVVLAQDVTVLDEQPAAVPEEINTDPVIVEEAVEDTAVSSAVEEDEALEQDGVDMRSLSLMEAYPQMVSLFFSRWEHDLIIDARLGFNTRPPEVPVEDISSPASIQAGEVGVRELSLGGIVFNSPTNWTLWLNGMRVTPTGLPEQVMDIKVFKDYIEIEWLDTATNQIYPIRLRPHQRFNLDTRIFLPG